MITISLCMIVKNEEEVLERCLSCVREAVDEIIIVDTGSLDKTKEIASAFTDKIYDFQWIDDFSAARNFAFSKATMDYQMWLDADDIIEKEELSKLIKLKSELSPETSAVTMLYHVAFDGSGNPTLSSRRERLLRRIDGFRWNDPVHECITMSGNILDTDIAVTHKKNGSHGDRNLRIYRAQESAGIPFSPRSLYYFARELADHEMYNEAAAYFEKFLDGGGGWIEDNIGACFSLGGCYKKLGDKNARSRVLLRSFLYDLPRSEICCELAYDFMEQNDFERAEYWLLTALDNADSGTLGFVLWDYHAFIPNIELAVCYWRMGLYEEAVYRNEEAGKIKPDSAAVKHNREFFATLIEK